MNTYVKRTDFEQVVARLAAVEEMLETIEDVAARAALERAKADDDGVRIAGSAVTAMIVDGVHPVQAIRKARHLSQADLAEQAGTSAAYISQIERRNRHAGRGLEARIATALGVTPADLRED